MGSSWFVPILYCGIFERLYLVCPFFVGLKKIMITQLLDFSINTCLIICTFRERIVRALIHTKENSAINCSWYIARIMKKKPFWLARTKDQIWQKTGRTWCIWCAVSDSGAVLGAILSAQLLASLWRQERELFQNPSSTVIITHAALHRLICIISTSHSQWRHKGI